MNNIILKKQGNILLPIGLVVLIVVFVTVFLVYCQLNIIVQNVRRDLYYISKDAILSFDLQDLAHKKYTVDEAKTKQIIEYLLNKNYTKTEGSINKIQITSLEIFCEQDKVNIAVGIQVSFRSVVSLMGKNEHKFKMKENVSVSLLKYK